MSDEVPSDDEIHGRMHPSPSEVALAKEIIVTALCSASGPSETTTLVRACLRGAGQSPESYPTSSQNRPSDLGGRIDRVRWVNAAHQGIAELAGVGLALPAYGQHDVSSSSVEVRTTNRGWGVQCPDYDFRLAQRYHPSTEATARDGQGFVLQDADLYLRRVGANVMHPRVAATLREAVGCYRSRLYLGAAILLGAASEGAWMELAQAYRAYADARDETVAGTLRGELESETPRVERVQRALYDKLRSHLTDVRRGADLSTGAVDQLVQTADYYRRLRNYALHFREDALERLEYATVGVLLLNATHYFNAIYRLKAALEA